MILLAQQCVSRAARAVSAGAGRLFRATPAIQGLRPQTVGVAAAPPRRNPPGWTDLDGDAASRLGVLALARLGPTAGSGSADRDLASPETLSGRLRTRLAAGARLLGQSVVGFGLALIVSFWIAAFTLVYQDRAALHAQVLRDAGNLALVFEEYVAHTVADIDRGLMFLRWARADAPSTIEWQDIVAQDFVANRETAQTSVIDADGVMITSTAMLRPSTRVWLGDREHFLVQRDSSDDRLFISRPVLGRVSGKWSVQFSRKFTDAAGQFAGVLVISLDASRLAHSYGELNFGARGGVALVGDDGVTRAGSGVFADELGRLFGPPRDNATQEPVSGLLTVERHVDGAPLKVIVAAPNEANNPRWIARRYAYYAVALTASVLAVIATLAVALRRQRSDAQILYLARFDSLTNLANRRQLTESLDALFALPPADRAYALHIVDLDRFKYVNDTYGHPFGDAILREAADRLLALVRPSDLVVRLGGDEFAILQSLRFARTEAQALAQRLCREMAKPFEVRGAKVVIGATIGVSSAAEDAQSGSELLKAADLALYAAKAEDKGGFRFFDAAMARAVLERSDIEAGLRTAIDNDELRLFFQPIVDLNDHRTIGYEALIRWARPHHGMVSPLDFIPVAEETGLIVKIGDWVLRRACADVAALPSPARVAVNCSPIQFELSDVAASVRAALEESGLPPQRLEIEITESALMKNNQRVVDQLRRLRAIGVRVSIDDFGTGFSSLSYLERFPITTIKIDRSFVQKIGQRDGARATVRAIIELASSYKMTALAEGVETEDQMRALLELGCNHGQGFLFGRPRPYFEIWQSQAFPPVSNPAQDAA